MLYFPDLVFLILGKKFSRFKILRIANYSIHNLVPYKQPERKTHSPYNP